MSPVEWLSYEFFGNSLGIWGIALGLFLAAWLAGAAALRLVRGRLRSLAARTESARVALVGNVVGQTKSWFIALVALYVGSRVPALPMPADSFISRLAFFGLMLQAGLWATAVLQLMFKRRREQQLEEDPGSVAAMDVMGFVIRVVIWSIVLLLVLENFGIDITALVAGLGVGGIAVALAAQNILGDLFASLSIVLDKPFVVGDFLNIDDLLGSVEKVGLKTTRLRSLSGEQLVISNNDLLGSRIRNYGRMFERRVVFSLGVTYQTPAEKLRRIPGIIREVIESCEPVRFDRAHFSKYGDFALIFEAVYYVLVADYNRYMDIHQEINLAIYERFAHEEIEFAYPTQTLYVARA